MCRAGRTHLVGWKSYQLVGPGPFCTRAATRDGHLFNYCYKSIYYLLLRSADTTQRVVYTEHWPLGPCEAKYNYYMFYLLMVNTITLLVQRTDDPEVLSFNYRAHDAVPRL